MLISYTEQQARSQELANELGEVCRLHKAVGMGLENLPAGVDAVDDQGLGIAPR